MSNLSPLSLNILKKKIKKNCNGIWVKFNVIKKYKNKKVKSNPNP